MSKYSLTLLILFLIVSAIAFINIFPNFSNVENLSNLSTENKESPSDNLLKIKNNDITIQSALHLYNSQQYKKALEAFNTLLEREGPSAVVLNNICACNNNIGSFEDAAFACQQALNIEPDFQLAKNNLQVSIDALSKIQASK